jgi:hypothetical protein
VRLVVELDWKGHGRVLHLLQRAVDQGFIQIQDEGETGTGPEQFAQWLSEAFEWMIVFILYVY